MLFLITLNTKSNFLFLISHIHIVFYTSLETFGNLKITNEINRLQGELKERLRRKFANTTWEYCEKIAKSPDSM